MFGDQKTFVTLLGTNITILNFVGNPTTTINVFLKIMKLTMLYIMIGRVRKKATKLRIKQKKN